jgi:hypothetical protein
MNSVHVVDGSSNGIDSRFHDVVMNSVHYVDGSSNGIDSRLLDVVINSVHYVDGSSTRCVLQRHYKVIRVCCSDTESDRCVLLPFTFMRLPGSNLYGPDDAVIQSITVGAHVMATVQRFLLLSIWRHCIAAVALMTSSSIPFMTYFHRW